VGLARASGLAGSAGGSCNNNETHGWAQHIKEDVIWPNQDICFWKTENGRLDIGSRTKRANGGGHPSRPRNEATVSQA